MGMTSQLPSFCQNHYIPVPALLQMSIHTLGFDIPLLPPQEPECMTLPLGKTHTIPEAASPKTPLKPRISIATEVNDLLTQAMADESSHESEHSAIGKAATAEGLVSPCHKSEAPPLPVNTSSQASMEEGEASLKSNPANISPIAATYSSCSASPSVDPTELQTDANLATNHMLHVKRSTDLTRQQVIWELGLLLCKNEVNEAASIEKAKVVHAQEVLDSKVVPEAKCNYRVAIQEAKMIRGNQHQ